MVDRNLIRDFQIDDDELTSAFGDTLSQIDIDESAFDRLIDVRSNPYDENQIIKGTILSVDGDDVMVDLGFKSEGIVPLSEWEEGDPPPEPGQTIEVLMEDMDDRNSLILLSKKKADRQRDWERVISNCKEGEIVEGVVVKKIKGGLLVKIGDDTPSDERGVNVFLPASQVDIRRPHDIGDFINQKIKCVILKIDESRRNIVVSRRRLIEDQRAELKRKLLSDLHEGDVRKGIVKNIADFGAFVDLGGIDGLLHITDMDWGRINHPSEMVQIDQEVEVKILNVDRDREKIALGMKQLRPSPWEHVEQKYPVGSHVKGTVVNIMTYGAFVKLEDGIEGLVHISEMSWTRRINHPSELVKVDDVVDVVVLAINTQKQEISLGMKQTQPNPWDNVTEKYPVGSTVKGVVRNLTNYGAFIELEEGVDGLLHVSDMSWTRKVSHASELLKKGDEITCQIVSVDENRKRIALGLKQLDEDPWETQIPDKYQPGTIVTGKVTKITNFGVFVELEPELEGLLHVSELSDHKVNSPDELVKVGDELEVKVLRVDTHERKIGLSRRLDVPVEEIVEEQAAGRASREELKGGMGGSAGPLFSYGNVPDEDDEN
jgi:small subunit ribosomal protein S1